MRRTAAAAARVGSAAVAATVEGGQLCVRWDEEFELEGVRADAKVVVDVWAVATVSNAQGEEEDDGGDGRGGGSHVAGGGRGGGNVGVDRQRKQTDE
eukprot:2637784-Pleurochrysis_carterae.AAC.1